MRCGFVAVVGAPNAGKSTLVNRLVGSKISIVTHKVQTTRMRIRGVAITGDSQIVLIDTPGLFEPRRRLDRAMVTAAWNGVSDADASVLMIDARDMLQSGATKDATAHKIAIKPEIQKIIDQLGSTKRKVILALNKIDAVPKPLLLEMTNEFKGEDVFNSIFMISALKGDGADDLKKHLAEIVPEGPWLFPEDQVADLPLRSLAAEITREKLILRLHQELPYVSTVETESWTEKRDGSVKIEQIIYVTRDSHKPIVLGKKGQTLKDIGQSVRVEMEQVFARRVHLFLFVKVRAKWTEDPLRYRAMGLEFPNE
jgi:GTP-binding protein Era